MKTLAKIALVLGLAFSASSIVKAEEVSAGNFRDFLAALELVTGEEGLVADFDEM